MYLRRASRKESEGTAVTEPRSGRRADDIVFPEQNRHITSSSISHPPTMNGHCARMFVQGRRDTCSAAQYASPQGSSQADCDKIRSMTLDQPPRRSSTSHPPVMSGHCARMLVAGRPDSCSGVRYPFFEEPEKASPAQEILQDLKKTNWGSRDIVNGKPRENKK